MHPSDLNALLILLNAALAVVFIVARWRQRERIKERVVAAVAATLIWLSLIAGSLGLATPWSPDGAIIVTAISLLAVILVVRGNPWAGAAAGIHTLLGIAAILHAQRLLSRPDCVGVYWNDREVVRLALLCDDLEKMVASHHPSVSSAANDTGWIEDASIRGEIDALARQKVGTNRWHTWFTHLRGADPSLRYAVWIEAASRSDMPVRLSIRTRPR